MGPQPSGGAVPGPARRTYGGPMVVVDGPGSLVRGAGPRIRGGAHTSVFPEIMKLIGCWTRTRTAQFPIRPGWMRGVYGIYQ